MKQIWREKNISKPIYFQFPKQKMRPKIKKIHPKASDA